MCKEKEFHERKSNRLKTFDYSASAAYFLTICTSERRKVLSEIILDIDHSIQCLNVVQSVGDDGLVCGLGHLGSESPPDSHSIPSVSLRYLGVPEKQTKDHGNVELVGDDVLGVPKTNKLKSPLVPGNVNLLPYGEIANKYIIQLNDFYESIHVDAYVIMPNHIHILLWIGKNGTPSSVAKPRVLNDSLNDCQTPRCPSPQARPSSPTRQTSTVSHFVSTFKRFCNKEYGTNIWQRGFYDHIIRCSEDYEETKKYIYENPINWYYDELYSGNIE